MEPCIETPQKKRGRKKKEIVTETIINIECNSNIQFDIIPISNISEMNELSEVNILEQNELSEDVPVHKKRGRKPKGGKLIVRNTTQICSIAQENNIILHLKCSSTDLNNYNQNYNQQVLNPMTYNPTAPPDIKTYNNEEKNVFSSYNSNINSSVNILNDLDKNYAYLNTDVIKKCNCGNTTNDINDTNDTNDINDNTNIKEINNKLKQLKIDLYKNTMTDKKSACFWCTYEYDNQACYIPKYKTDGTIFGYGSFCRPECAAAFLMKENIDDSSKFDRYNLLNQIYSKIYDFKKNIKPAPNPYYLLDKFYGNLSIQEYRRLLKSEHMLLVIDKPLTRILPELHEDTDEFILNIYGNSENKSSVKTQQSNGVYKVKRQSEKVPGPSKSSIVHTAFGCC
jgi:hypothetical protein